MYENSKHLKMLQLLAQMGYKINILILIEKCFKHKQVQLRKGKVGKWCNVLEISKVTQFKTFTLGSGKRMFQVDATLPLLQVWVDYFKGRLRKRANVLTTSADIENEASVTWKSSEMVGFSSLSNFEVNT